MAGAEINHSQRGHARWSASSTTANVNCSGRLTLVEEANLPDLEGEAAAWGTACHEISERVLRSPKIKASSFIDEVIKTKRHNITVDEEMVETSEVYTDYVFGRLIEYADYCIGEGVEPDGKLLIEQNFSFASLNPPFEAGGTGDAIMYFPLWKLLEVADLKGGRGVVVEVEGNMQARSYGLGAVLSMPGLDVETVMSTIVQPRAFHASGRIRSEKYHISELIEWTADLLVSMGKSKQAMDDRQTMTPMAWAEKYLKAGDHCKFCPVAGICPALEQKALDAAMVYFDDLDQPQIKNKPDTMTPEQLSARLDLLDMIEDWIKAVRSYSHYQAESGVEIPHYILVAKQGREKFKEGAEDAVVTAAEIAGLEEKQFRNPGKLRTPKQIRKELGKDNAHLLADFTETPSNGTNLVREDKTSRKAEEPKVNAFFDILD